MEIAINYFAVGAAAVAAVVLGSLWYGPIFGKVWMKEMGFPEGHAMKGSGSMARSYGLMALGSIVMAFVLAHSIAFARLAGEMSNINAGLQGGFWNWLGFVAPVTLGVVLWELFLRRGNKAVSSPTPARDSCSPHSFWISCRYYAKKYPSSWYR
jgi:hypothetical protein